MFASALQLFLQVFCCSAADPIVQQQAYLKGHIAAPIIFAYSVSVSGDTVVVGAPNFDTTYVFVRNGTSWSEQARLSASNPGEKDGFGGSVSVFDDTVVVGAAGESSSATGVNGDQHNNRSPQSGAAYVFVRSGTNWSQQAYLKASNTDRGDWFGRSVSLSGDTLGVGATREESNATGVNGDQSDNSAPRAGAAYVFVRNGTTWSQQAYLKASNAEANDIFGAVSLSGDTLVVAAQQEDSSATGVNGNQSDNSASDSGAAYVFVRSGTSWSQQAYLKASNCQAGDLFGGFAGMHETELGSVAVSGDTIVVGAPFEDSRSVGVNGNQNDNSGINGGAAYVFVRRGTTWHQEAYLKASNTEYRDDWFGFSVSISGDTVLVGAPREESNATGVNGNQNNNHALWSGATYLFVRSGSTWSQLAYLKASNTGDGDRFGDSVSVWDNTLVVGATGERSNATGVNGDQSDNSVFCCGGAAYAFEIPTPVTYCTGKTTSAGCLPFVSALGTPSASSGSFIVRSNDHLVGQPGMLIYSTSKGNRDFHGGKLCVKAPFHRLETLIQVHDGLACTGCAGSCRMFKRDFNQLIQSGTDPMLTSGQQVYVQVRQSDPGNLGPTGFADNLSDALSFAICP